MADDRSSSPPPRARACGDLPLERLLGRAEELARRWAIALVAARPIEGLASVPLGELAGEGPELCRGLLGALHSQEELARLTGVEDRERSILGRLASVSGARDGRELVEAVETLRGTAWELLQEEIGGQLAFSPRALAEVGDRLAFVCSRLLAEAIAGVVLAGEQPAHAVDSPGFPVRPVRSSRPAAPERVAIFDERAESDPERAEGPREGLGGAGTAAGPSAEDGPVAHRLATLPAALRDELGAFPSIEPAGPEIEIRDERREEGPAAWIGAIGRQLERFAADGRPFAVLLVEPLDPERGAAGPPGLERLLADELARAGSGGWLTRERPGRHWLIAPETDRIAAARLRERLELTVGSPAARPGARAAIAVGVAICPEDGERAPALAAHADVGLYAARAEARAAAARAAGEGSGAA